MRINRARISPSIVLHLFHANKQIIMPKREDYELSWTRYQKEGVPNEFLLKDFVLAMVLPTVS